MGCGCFRKPNIHSIWTLYTHTHRNTRGEHPIRKCPVAETISNYHVSNIAFPGTGRSNWQKVTRILNHTVSFTRTARAYAWTSQHSESQRPLSRSLDVRPTSYACTLMCVYPRRLIATFGAFNFCLPFGLISKWMIVRRLPYAINFHCCCRLMCALCNFFKWFIQNERQNQP